MDDLRREFLKHLFGRDIDGEAHTYTSTEPTVLTSEALDKALALLEKFKKDEETRQKLASGDYYGIMRREQAEEAGLTIQRDEDGSAEYAMISNTKFYFAPTPEEETVYLIPKPNYDMLAHDPFGYRVRYPIKGNYFSTYTDPPV